jgi:hypothetical protein
MERLQTGGQGNTPALILGGTPAETDTLNALLESFRMALPCNYP